ncbi:type III pantothenate kinase [bacterium]|nr:type III pantothenate kinase [bacterium]
MLKILLIDIGNSRTKACEWDAQTMKPVFSCDTSVLGKALAELDLTLYSRCVVASVVPDSNDSFKGLSIPVQLIDHESVSGITIEMDKPEEVGADRLVSAAGAYSEYKQSVLVVDAGTAVTFCYVAANGVYKGGAILPGMAIASKALNDYTAKIPLVWVAEQKSLLGKTTKEAVEIGLYHGYIAMINGMIAQYREMDPGVVVIGSGNGIEVLGDRLNLDETDQLLPFKGLALTS